VSLKFLILCASSGLQSSNTHRSKTNQLIQIAFVTLLAPLRRSYLNFIIFFVLAHSPLQFINFFQSRHSPFSRFSRYSVSEWQSRIELLSHRRLDLFIASVSSGARQASTFFRLVASPWHVSTFLDFWIRQIRAIASIWCSTSFDLLAFSTDLPCATSSDLGPLHPPRPLAVFESARFHEFLITGSAKFRELRYFSSELLIPLSTFEFTRFAQATGFKQTFSIKDYKVSLQGAPGCCITVRLGDNETRRRGQGQLTSILTKKHKEKEVICLFQFQRSKR
jgi:hypothetical protein